EGWEYGINIDWAGKIVEAASGQKLDAYFQQNILGPLGMKDTSFTLSASQRARLASVHQPDEKGALAPTEFGLPENPEFLMGAGACAEASSRRCCRSTTPRRWTCCRGSRPRSIARSEPPIRPIACT